MAGSIQKPPADVYKERPYKNGDFYPATVVLHNYVLADPDLLRVRTL
jgi:hypothetical protein